MRGDARRWAVATVAYGVTAWSEICGVWEIGWLPIYRYIRNYEQQLRGLKRLLLW